jgi:hypothetical protein
VGVIRLALVGIVLGLVAWAIVLEVRRDRRAKRWNSVLAHAKELEKSYRFGAHDPTDEARA